MEKTLDKIQQLLILMTIFLFPIFFLPITQEFFQTNKFFLLGVMVGILMLISIFRFLFSRKIILVKTPFDAVLLLFLLTQLLSLVIQSPNKVAGLFALPTGLAFFFLVTVFYFIVVNAVNKEESEVIHNILMILAAVVSVTTIAFYFAPLKNVALPSYLQFLQSPSFTPVGSRVELMLLLGFFAIHLLIHSLKKMRLGTASWSKKVLAPGAILIITAIALSLSVYATTRSPLKDDLSLKLPPFDASWYAAVETLKRPSTAIFGVGTDNFISAFTQTKPITYNQSDFWQLNFNKSRSTLMHIWTESGLLGMVALLILGFVLFKTLLSLRLSKNERSDYLIAASLYILAAILFFPPSLPILFLFFTILALVGIEAVGAKKISLDMNSIPAAYLAISIISMLSVLAMFYFLGRAYLAEYYFKRSLNGLIANNGRVVYDNLLKATQISPNNETYRLTFSQINLLIANNIATRAAASQQEGTPISDSDRQTIAQAIQQAIVEAKAAVQLNPNKMQNWENLAVIYRNIINVAEGGDTWTIASYQRAILLDPVNPQLRLNLGGVYFSLKNYPAAAQLFEQAVTLKRDWANAHYNLAWALYQNGNYPQAVAAMQNVLSLVEKSNPDYLKAEGELEEFRQKLPDSQNEASAEAELTPSEQEELTLPTPPQPEISPKIELPEDSQPPATEEAGSQ